MLESLRLAKEAETRAEQAKATAELVDQVSALELKVDRILSHFETLTAPPAPAPKSKGV